MWVIPSSGCVKIHLNIGKTGDMAPESKKAQSKQFKLWSRQEAMPSVQHFSMQKPHPQTTFFQEQRSFNCWRWTTAENVEFKVLPLKDQIQLLAFQLWPHRPVALPSTSQKNWSFVPKHSAIEGKHYSGKRTDSLTLASGWGPPALEQVCWWNTVLGAWWKWLRSSLYCIYGATFR